MPTTPHAFALLRLLCALAWPFSLEVAPKEPRPGDVLRVEAWGEVPEGAVCTFRGGRYPLYKTAPRRWRALVPLTAESKPGKAEVRVGRGGFLRRGPSEERGVEVQPKTFTRQEITMPEGKVALAEDPEGKAALSMIGAIVARESAEQHWSGPFLQPVPGRLSSSYGHSRKINRSMAWDWHKGLDIGAPAGTRAVAPGRGRVVLAGSYPVQGGTLIIDHGQGVFSAFLHLSEIDAEVGDIVERGQAVAKVGSEGFSTGPHLHWGLYVHGAPVDPAPWLTREF